MAVTDNGMHHIHQRQLVLIAAAVEAIARFAGANTINCVRGYANSFRLLLLLATAS